MTRRAFNALTRHFVGAILQPPILSDVGIDAFRRTLITAVSFFLCVGAFLPRIFTKKYRLLSMMPSPEPYLLVWPGDTLFMLALPMYVVGFAAVIVSPMLFPDETDYRVLTPLPLKRSELFATKLAALVIVAATAILAVNAVISLTLPAVTGGRWATHGILARVSVHWITACIASAWTVSAVMAVQGICLLAVPERWRHRAATTVQASVFLLLLVSVPFFVRLTGRTVTAATVAASPQDILAADLVSRRRAMDARWCCLGRLHPRRGRRRRSLGDDDGGDRHRLPRAVPIGRITCGYPRTAEDPLRFADV